MWVSVKESYPEFLQEYGGWQTPETLPVLCCVMGSYPEIKIATFTKCEDTSEVKCWSKCSERWELNNVTHWMPLPFLP